MWSPFVRVKPVRNPFGWTEPDMEPIRQVWSRYETRSTGLKQVRNRFGVWSHCLVLVDTLAIDGASA
jgi:hypothetical protein